MPTTLFRGGRIRADFDGVVHDSLLARDGRVIAVGSAADVRAASGSVDETVDLDGAWVVPGLVDAHPHLLHFGVAAAGLADLSDARDHDDIVAAITAVASGAGTRRMGDGDARRRAALLLPPRPPAPALRGSSPTGSHSTRRPCGIP